MSRSCVHIHLMFDDSCGKLVWKIDNQKKGSEMKTQNRIVAMSYGLIMLIITIILIGCQNKKQEPPPRQIPKTALKAHSDEIKKTNSEIIKLNRKLKNLRSSEKVLVGNIQVYNEWFLEEVDTAIQISKQKFSRGNWESMQKTMKKVMRCRHENRKQQKRLKRCRHQIRAVQKTLNLNQNYLIIIKSCRTEWINQSRQKKIK